MYFCGMIEIRIIDGVEYVITLDEDGFFWFEDKLENSGKTRIAVGPNDRVSTIEEAVLKAVEMIRYSRGYRN